jgi:hypothetical protein
MNVDGVFLVAAENKDTYCLDPLKTGLSSRFENVHSLNFFDDINDSDGAILTEFARCTFPIAIISSAAMAGFLELIRPRESFLCIGLEHGIAPFKSYTYGRHLLSSDFYLAPTRGWAERLARLYPDARSQVRIGGYPKIEAIKERIDTKGATPGNLPKRILVILSWGVDEEAFKFLPDLDYIDYVLHPADYKLIMTVNLKKARLYVSNPDITYDLIASASVVIGDFSSLTLECIYLNKHVVFMVDRSIYKSNCDMDAQFFNEDSSEFGIIPESGGRINIEDSITATQFACLATTFGVDIDAFKARTTRASFDPIFLPPADKNNVELCAEEICKLRDLAGAWTLAKHYSEEEAVGIVRKMCFISSSYQSILGRPSDRSGLRHYLKRITEFDGSALHSAVSVWHEITTSSEAKRRSATCPSELPRISYPDSDPIKSAHSFAAKNRLVEALCWVTMAIERHPSKGEYLRLKASILERMGRFEEALQVAHEAKALGADPDCIGVDIDRINSLHVLELWKNAASDNRATSLVSYSQLLAMGKLSLRDVMKFARKLVKATV